MEFKDLKKQYKHIQPSVDRALAQAIDSADFISGAQVRALEQTLAVYTGCRHCISCANGTDAISIALAAHGVGTGDAVFVPDFTFFSSGECPAAAGATPIFVDVLPTTYNIDPAALQSAVEDVIAWGRLRPRAVIAVDLFGQPFAYEAVRSICSRYHLLLIEDAAQGFGGHIRLKRAGGAVKMACSLGDIATTSFFPAKPLGCYGDGGAIFTNDDDIASLCRSLAVHGKDMEHPDDPDAKYHNIRIGRNSRLDTIQAAVLLAKFPVFCGEELDAANRVASLYASQLSEVEGLVIPTVLDGAYSSWAQYTIQLPEGTDRAAVRQELKRRGVPTNIYYIKPMHKQGAFQSTRSAEADCPVTEKLCERVLCLPIHPYLTQEEALAVCEALKTVLDSSRPHGGTPF